MARARSGSRRPRGTSVTTLTHDETKRKNIPTAEYQSVLDKQKLAPVR
jgi:adenine-specific DNA-methyltransferase